MKSPLLLVERENDLSDADELEKKRFDKLSWTALSWLKVTAFASQNPWFFNGWRCGFVDLRRTVNYPRMRRFAGNKPNSSFCGLFSYGLICWLYRQLGRDAWKNSL